MATFYTIFNIYVYLKASNFTYKPIVRNGQSYYKNYRENYRDFFILVIVAERIETFTCSELEDNIRLKCKQLFLYGQKRQ